MFARVCLYGLFVLFVVVFVICVVCECVSVAIILWCACVSVAFVSLSFSLSLSVPPCVSLLSFFVCGLQGVQQSHGSERETSTGHGCVPVIFELPRPRSAHL